jgi:hypothetical protein
MANLVTLKSLLSAVLELVAGMMLGQAMLGHHE